MSAVGQKRKLSARFTACAAAAVNQEDAASDPRWDHSARRVVAEGGLRSISTALRCTLMFVSVGAQMKRREFLAGVLPVAVVPPAWAQQPAMPVVGCLNFGTPDPSSASLSALRVGL